VTLSSGLSSRQMGWDLMLFTIVWVLVAMPHPPVIWSAVSSRAVDLILAAGGAEGNIGGQPYFEVMMHNVAVLGTIWFNSAELDEMITLIDAGVIDVSFLRHKFFSLDEVNEAFRTVGDRPGGAVNVVVQPHV